MQLVSVIHAVFTLVVLVIIATKKTPSKFALILLAISTLALVALISYYIHQYYNVTTSMPLFTYILLNLFVNILTWLVDVVVYFARYRR